MENDFMMTESSRTINHKLNDLLSKNNISKNKLDAPTALGYASVLRTNILGKDKQEKVNSIVVLAKLLDCITGSDAVTNEFSTILDHTLFGTLFSIVSANMSTETYKAILKISVIVISASIFRTKDDSFDKYLPFYESLIEYLDVIDIITQKLYLQDNKITYNSIKLVTDLINRALDFDYSGIITLAGRLKHVTYFSTVGNLIETEDKAILDAIENLKVSYFNLNEKLNSTRFDLSIKSHQVMLNNLFIYLEVSLNEFGTPATPDEYVKAGFTDNPRNFVVDNFTILLAMDLKIFLKDPNFTFKKRFHEELMMSDHNRTFPLSLFIEKVTDMWLELFHKKVEYPCIYESILSWELMIYYTMNNCLILWQETRAQLENSMDVDKILQLLYSNVDNIELELSKQDKTIEECLDITNNQTGEDLRHIQVMRVNEAHRARWRQRLTEFNRDVTGEVMDFVAEQRAMQLLSGSWVFTEQYGEQMLKNNKEARNKFTGLKVYYLTLSPNRQLVYYKSYQEKPLAAPNYEELESTGGQIRVTDIADMKSTKVGESLGEADKAKSSMLISVKGSISYEKITLSSAEGKKLLSFYTDTEVSKYVWLDGLKMIKKQQAKDLSSSTAQQVESLINLRLSTQLLALEHPKIAALNLEEEDIEEEEDDEYHSLSELLEVTEEDKFYYR
ncbi:ELMO family protein Lmo1p [Diutina catenulata]